MKVENREEILSIINSRKEYLQKQYHLNKIALIGSFARNEQTSSSDVDLLIELPENTPHLYELKKSLKQELELLFGRPVEIASERYLKPYFRDEIIRKAIYV